MSGNWHKTARELITVKRGWFLTVVITGIVLPLILMIWLACTHGTIDNILYGALKWPYLLFMLIVCAILVMASISLGIYARKSGGGTGLIMATLILSIISILITLILAAYVAVPQLTRNGDTQPQLIISEAAREPEMPVISLVFRTETPTQNSVEYGTIEPGIRHTIYEDRPVQSHWFYLAGLEPGKQCYYSLNDGQRFEFKTPSWQDSKLRFAAAGDPHFGNPRSRNDLTMSMLENIKNPENDYSMFFILGDCADLGFMDRQWKQAFNEISRCSSTIPVCYLTGNHDTLFGGVNLYRDYLCQPGHSQENKDCLWKRIDIGDVHFIILDVEWSAELYTAAQQLWLQEQLKSIPPDDWCIVMNHTFYYCSGGYIDGWEWYDNELTIATLTPLFEEYDVDIVMSGHKHQAELLQMNGVTYLVLGCFGGPQDPERTYISPASVWYQQGAYAFADITVEAEEASIVIRDADHNSIFQTIVQR
jgi:predicted MPP superfamily phosphohydrolase